MHAWHPSNQDPRFAGHGSAEVTSLERKVLRWVSHVAAEPASHQRNVTGRYWPGAVSCNWHIPIALHKTAIGSTRPISAIRIVELSADERPVLEVQRSSHASRRMSQGGRLHCERVHATCASPSLVVLLDESPVCAIEDTHPAHAVRDALFGQQSLEVFAGSSNGCASAAAVADSNPYGASPYKR